MAAHIVPVRPYLGTSVHVIVNALATGPAIFGRKNWISRLDSISGLLIVIFFKIVVSQFYFKI